MKDRIRDLLDRNLMYISKGEEEKGSEKLCKEKIAENFPVLGKELDIKYMKLTDHVTVSIQKTLAWGQ